jgi:hypothetical protein
MICSLYLRELHIYVTKISSELKAPQVIHGIAKMAFEVERIQFHDEVFDVSTKQVDSIRKDELQELRYMPETTRTIPPRRIPGFMNPVIFNGPWNNFC